MDKRQLLQRLANQLAIDFNCSPEDFFRNETVLTTPACRSGRRQYIEGAFFFQMATLGGNAVLSADQRLHHWLSDYCRNRPGHILFEHQHLVAIDAALQQYGKALWQSHHLFLPDRDLPDPKPDFSLRWFEQQEMTPLYEKNLFPNALCERFLPQRPDVLAVAACDRGRIVGLAGCSADAPDFWQIGIDVMPDYRGKRIGQTLVLLLKNEILRRGKIPFYGTSLSNLYSQNIAQNTGFFPAWVEIESIEK